MRTLVTGCAGFIGFHLARALLAEGHEVAGIDSLNDYYSVRLKEDRLAVLRGERNFRFERMDMADAGALRALFAESRFTHVAHLAAQAGVRHSLENPRSYVSSNLVGFANLLECCRANPVRHLVYASSSSVYGLEETLPYSPHACADHPASLYAATKRSNELMAHAYSHLFGIPCTGLRFFTVYGPWGRPDMALHLFTDAIVNGRPIDVFNGGRMRRDFTYVDDVVACMVRLLPLPPAPGGWDARAADPASSSAPWRVCNVGNDAPVSLSDFISTLERVLGREARKNLLPMQPGDVPATWADVSDLAEIAGFRPETPLEDGMRRFWDWYREYYGVDAPAGEAR